MSLKRTIIAACIMLLTMVSLRYISHGEEIHPNKPLNTFPTKLGEWVGTEDRFDQKVYDILGVDDSILINYRDLQGRPAQLYVGFYQSQKEGDIIHSPKNCMPGAGWNIVQTSIEELNIDPNPEKIKMIKLILEKGIQKQIVLYWFQSGGRYISSEYLQKIYLVVDSITKRRTDGSFVRLIAPVVQNEKETLEHLKAFAKLVIPKLQEYLPS